ncbi:MAG: UpxY family transcription antiterminator [Paludibaculum sp.]
MYPWYAVRVRSNREAVVSLHLRERGLEEFTPSYRVERQWSDRVKYIDQPLFPGYVFCRLNLNNRMPVLTVPGVVGLVGVGKQPVTIAEAEVERVRTMVRSGVAVSPWPFLKEGDPVLIERGPLAGLEGILQRLKGKLRIVVSVSLLQRSVSAEIDTSWVRPLLKSCSSIDLLGDGGSIPSQTS